MADATSPTVTVFETDLTTRPPAISTSIGAIAGVFRWGPVGQRVLIDSEPLLALRLGKPTNFNAETWFTVASFLAYGAPAQVVRVANTTSLDGNVAAYNAVANTGAVANVELQVIRTEDDYLDKAGTFDSDALFVARWPGAIGNSLRVSMCDSADAFESTVALVTNASVIESNSSIAIAVGATTGLVTLVAASGANASQTTAEATTVANSISVGDLVEVGNTRGSQLLKVTNVSSVTTSGNNALFTLTFEDRLKLSANVSESTIRRRWEFRDAVDQAPTTSSYVDSFGNSAAVDQVHVVVVDEDGLFSGVPGQVLETWRGLSRATDAKGLDGAGIYFRDVINQGSSYIWSVNDRSGAASNTAVNVASSSNTKPLNLDFVAGSDGADESNVAITTLASGYDLFANPDEADVSLMMQGRARGGTNGAQLANYIIDNVITPRNPQDVVLFVSPERADVVSNPGDEVTDVVEFFDDIGSCNRAAFDCGYKQMYDRYNDLYRWVPLNGDHAGIYARTDATHASWWSGAGFRRGQLKNVVRLAWNPSKAQRDELFKNRVNPIVTFPGQGTILYGDKTGQTETSDFDAMNVVRLFIYLEKKIAQAAKYSLFEFNDEFTQAQFRNLVTPELRLVQGARGLRRFLVVCDGTNNTQDVVDRAEFRADIYLTAARAIRDIRLNFIAVRGSVQFSEVVGSF
jgi:hypothetical protein